MSVLEAIVLAAFVTLCVVVFGGALVLAAHDGDTHHGDVIHYQLGLVTTPPSRIA